MDVRITVAGATKLEAAIVARIERLADLRRALEAAGELTRATAERRIAVGGEPAWPPSIREKGFSYTSKSGAVFTFGGTGKTGTDTGKLRQSIQWTVTDEQKVIVGSNLPYARWFQEGTGVYAGHTGWTVRPIHGPRDPRGRTKTGRKAVGTRPLPAAALAWSIGGRMFFARSVFISGAVPRPYLFFDQQLVDDIVGTFKRYLAVVP